MEICTRCVLDSTLKDIRFDKAGVCNHCKKHDVLMASSEVSSQSSEALEKLIKDIQQNGFGKQYDCIVGVSGGTDSTYVLYLAKKFGLRALAVHFDDGWNTDIAVSNIHAAVNTLRVDLETQVVDWEEMKDLHRSFFKASVPDPGVPSDVGIFGSLYRMAAREGIKYILGGQSFLTEGTQPREWSYIDGTYVRSIHKLFGEVPIKTFPNLNIYQAAYYIFVKQIKMIPFLNYVPYSKEEAANLLKKELGWQDYGGHHYESVYSQFINAFYDIEKFNIDRRKVTLSARVRTGKLNRKDALEMLRERPPITEETIDYCIGKLGFSKNEFNSILDLKPKSFQNYKTSYPTLKKFSFVLKLAIQLRLVTPVLYQKYLG